jgi:hypothetical protein
MASFERILSIHHPDWSCLLGVLMAYRDIGFIADTEIAQPPSGAPIWLINSPLRSQQGKILLNLAVERRCGAATHLGCAISDVMFDSKQGKAQPANPNMKKRKKRSDSSSAAGPR